MASQAELNYFIEVANCQNFSRASERLGISQPSLSLAIKRLEEAIGTELFIRHKKGISLTQAGKQLLTHAYQLLQYWDEVKSQALASHHEIQGNYTLGCHCSIGLCYLSKFLPKLLLTYPKLLVQLEYDISRKITERVISLSVDIGLVVNPIHHPDLIIQKLATDDMMFWVPRHINNSNVDINSKQAVIICDPELAQSEWLLKSLQKKQIKFSRIVHSANLEIVADLTMHGCGIGILPSCVAKSRAKSLKPISEIAVYQDEICLIYRPENRHIKAIQCITDAIKSCFHKK